MGNRPEKTFTDKFGSFANTLIYLHQFFNTLIKKGRGIWPDEALATLTVYATVKKVPTPPDLIVGKISQRLSLMSFLQY